MGIRGGIGDEPVSTTGPGRPFAAGVLLIVGVLAMSACTTSADPTTTTGPGITSTIDTEAVTTTSIQGAATTEGGDPAATTSPAEPPTGWAPDPVDLGGLSAIANTEGQRMLIHTEGGDRDFVVGVNIGATIPGHHPGELAVRREDFRRWFPMIADLGFRAIRVYTILPPHFYEELLAYNSANSDAPLYLIHGVWIPGEEIFLAEHDLFIDEVRTGFLDEIGDAVGAVFGEITIPSRPGRASGAFTADVSPWLLAWAIGVEMDPTATKESDAVNADRPPFRGAYVTAADDATPTESWLAEGLDRLAGDLAERNVTMPLTFNNWPTADPLEHPYEPLEGEDLVGIDANHILATPAWPGGLFASYHAYPYYPDFQRHQPGIADFVHEGELDPYAGYLTLLRDHHAGMPLMITEVGVPSSIGTAHTEPLGRGQGDHSEQEAMAIDADLVEVIAELDLAGAMVFAWTDEWFKVTWNTIDLEFPGERRPQWKNPWTNEQHFGILAHDPGPGPEPLVGSDAGWDVRDAQTLHESRDPLREVRATHDPGYLYLRLVLDDPDRTENITIDVDVLDDTVLPEAEPGRDPAADHAISLPPAGDGQAWVRAANDPFTIVYGLGLGYVDADPADLDPAAGVWHPQRLIINRPLTVPPTGEELPAEEFPVGVMRRGTADPEAADFDSRALWSEAEGVIRLRLPWATLGLADPSSLQALRVSEDGTMSTEAVDGVTLHLSLGDQALATVDYAWEGWQQPVWHERVKAGVEVLAETVQSVMAGD